MTHADLHAKRETVNDSPSTISAAPLEHQGYIHPLKSGAMKVGLAKRRFSALSGGTPKPTTASLWAGQYTLKEAWMALPWSLPSFYWSQCLN